MVFIFLLILLLAFITAIIVMGVFCTMVIEDVLYLRKPNAPFVPVPDATLQELVKYIPVEENSVIYDLGSGDGKILRALSDYNNTGTFVGIERGIIPYVVSSVRQKNIQSISFRREDFFVTDVSSATAVVVYLYPKLMDALLQKLTQELAPGTRLYSIDYHFSHKNPEETIVLSNTPLREPLSRIELETSSFIDTLVSLIELIEGLDCILTRANACGFPCQSFGRPGRHGLTHICGL